MSAGRPVKTPFLSPEERRTKGFRKVTGAPTEQRVGGPGGGCSLWQFRVLPRKPAQPQRLQEGAGAPLPFMRLRCLVALTFPSGHAVPATTLARGHRGASNDGNSGSSFKWGETNFSLGDQRWAVVFSSATWCTWLASRGESICFLHSLGNRFKNQFISWKTEEQQDVSLWERPERTVSSRQAARSPGTELGQSPRSSWVPRAGAGPTVRGGKRLLGTRVGSRATQVLWRLPRDRLWARAGEQRLPPRLPFSEQWHQGLCQPPGRPAHTAVVTAPRRYALTTSLATRLRLWLPGAHARAGGPRPCAAVGRVPLPALAGAGEGFTAGAQPPSPYRRPQYGFHRVAPSQPLNFLPAPVTNHRQNRACCWPFTTSSPHGTKGRMRSSRARIIHLPDRGQLPAASRGREPRDPPPAPPCRRDTAGACSIPAQRSASAARIIPARLPQLLRLHSEIIFFQMK